MTRPGLVLAAVLALAPAAPVAADEPVRALSLGDSFSGEVRPLRIEVESGLQFSRLALRGRADGEARLGPSGEKMVDANMIDLGGFSYQGRVRVSGEPLRPVRIELPSRVTLRSPNGGQAELSDFVTDLPQVAMLDQYGQLSFNFGARIATQGARGGNFRGRINIRVDYF
jgi:hypothetical protein